MVKVPLGTSDWRRLVSDEADIPVLNRYFEENPTNLEEQAALLSRPGLKRWLELGDGPIRAIYSQPGSFNNALFVVSASTLYRIDTNENITILTADIDGVVERRTPSMVATGTIGATPEYLFIADGATLWVYNGSTTTPVVTPDNVGVISLGYIASYVILVVAQGEGVNGRFYWIEPGSIVIDPLNFATAEKAPDPILSVQVVGDQFWLLGTNSTEVWYPTGDATSPFQRVQGRLFDRGIWEGTAVTVKDSVILVDTDGVVYQIAGGGPQRISDNSIEERIRKAMRENKLRGNN